MRINWTKEEVDYTFECLMKGMSAGEVAKDMTDKGMRSDCAPLTRNAIIGLWNRNKERKDELMKNSSTEIELAKIKKKVTKKAHPPKVKIVKEDVIPPEGVMFVNLKNNMCRFIFGDPLKEDMRYCGQKIDVTKNRSYCSLHHALCYRPTGKI